MFALTPEDLLGRIVDCAAGPASSNTELSAGGITERSKGLAYLSMALLVASVGIFARALSAA